MDQQDKLNKYLLLAIMGHISLLVIFGVTRFIFDWNIFHNDDDKKNIEIIQSSVRVDVVGLPKYTLKELKQMNLGASSKTEQDEIKTNTDTSKETSEIEFKKKSKKVDLSNILKNISNKNVAKKKSKTKSKKRNNIDARELNKLILEGNKVSQGSSYTGEQLDVSKQLFIRYVQELPDKVRPFWKLPTYLIDKNLQCRVQIFIGSDGRVLKMSLYESSGDKEYDKKAMEAIRAASPLPKPPTAILSKMAKGQVILGFPL